ncbi:efflux transporter periplasmic adaptor subunit [Luteibacter rhizovicinus DSM 16549]|uniref:Efflux transporter periplasmic adaptor subunit n=1 Tax=Luteibacter rhizovicinus DSM 16549 TaxID=1440763 RepID=A0A0G9HA63_9GAMM|nr:efflux RND transporter periplasmic adaptor subunit [Luteibacter rhizovicinus]APG02752.1 efflux transporter periplasmic adaptor subunit [Luteibacter rhizovicinus DSM 16549]KLD66361.1 ABC transporter permease [Luteibacter rhizovicinus DSM 16549]KLD76591.1 ABC transporter permease [Xanthomonas hyacinthi DSM 19077]
MIRDTSATDRLVEVGSNRKRKLIIYIGAGVAVVAALAFVLPHVATMFSADSSVSASRLSFATVSRGPFVRDIAAEGKVVAAVSPTLYATSAGAVVLTVHPGDVVKKDQVLATITSPDLAAKLAQERSAADAAKVEFLRAQIDATKKRSELQKAYDNAVIDQTAGQRDLKRYEGAFAKGAVPVADVDKAKSTLDKADVTVKHAQSDLTTDNGSLTFDIQAKKLAYDRQVLLVQDLERQVEELNVKSPVDGQVGQAFIAERATVAKDAQLLSVIDLSALQVEMKVPESFARDLAIGMPGEISGNGKVWNGKVSAISPEVVNGEVAARLRFDGATPSQLRQSQRLSVRVLLDKRDNVLTVQRGSFVDESAGRYAYVVADGMADRRDIRVGASSIDKVEILSGLKEGDKIVISGADTFGDAKHVAISR